METDKLISRFDHPSKKDVPKYIITENGLEEATKENVLRLLRDFDIYKKLDYLECPPTYKYRIRFRNNNPPA